MKTVNVTVEGISPLLMNRFTEEAQAKADAGTRMAFSSKNGTPREVAKPKLYLDSNNYPCLPGPNVFACIIDAGKFHKLGKSKVTTQRGSLIPAGIVVTNVDCPVTNNGEARSKTKWEVDSRPIVNPSTKGRRPCHRPRFDQWRTSFTMNVDEKMFDLNFVRQIVDDAGTKIGIGDFRPDRRGPFGRFKVISWEVEK